MFRFSKKGSQFAPSRQPAALPDPSIGTLGKSLNSQQGRVLAQTTQPVPKPPVAQDLPVAHPAPLVPQANDSFGSATAHSAAQPVKSTDASQMISPPAVDGGDLDFSVISTLRDIPQGLYVDFTALQQPIPASFGQTMAALKEGNAATVLVSKEAFGGHAYFELMKRLRDNGLQVVDSRKATEEVIRSLHEKNAPKSEATSHTDVEQHALELIIEAYKAGTSDIHIETMGKSSAKVLHRVHGERVEKASMSFSTAVKVANVYYNVWADEQNKTTAWDHTAVMSTSIERTMPDGKTVQLRFESTPIHPSGNFQIVMRLLRMDEQSSRPLDEMGYTPEMVASIDEMTIGSTGLVILVGPVNSGKSTTQQALLSRTRQRRGQNIKMVTVEDPVEYLIEGACQIGVPKGRKDQEEDSGNTFRSILKSTLRLDPDVLMIGEIRTEEVAAVVKDGVLTGKKYFSTLHASDAFTVFTRLTELGIPKTVLTSTGFLSGIIYQRLLPQVCPHCSLSLSQAMDDGLVDKDLYHRLSAIVNFHKDNVRVRRRNVNSVGCKECNYLGIVGRCVCAEVVVPDKTMLAYIMNGKEAEAKNWWYQNAKHRITSLGVSAMAHAILNMKLGLVDPVDIEINLGMIQYDNFDVTVGI